MFNSLLSCIRGKLKLRHCGTCWTLWQAEAGLQVCALSGQLTKTLSPKKDWGFTLGFYFGGRKEEETDLEIQMWVIILMISFFGGGVFLRQGLIMHFRVALAHFEAEAGLEFVTILLPQPPECWGDRHVPPCSALNYILLRSSSSLICDKLWRYRGIKSIATPKSHIYMFHDLTLALF